MHPKHKVGFNRFSPCVGDQLQSDSDLGGGDPRFLGLGVRQDLIPYVLLGCIWGSQPCLGQCISLGIFINHVNFQEQVIILHRGGCTVL